MNFEKQPEIENTNNNSFEKNEVLEDKLREILKLKQEMIWVRTNDDYRKIEDKIEKIYTDNNNELLNYEKEIYGT